MSTLDAQTGHHEEGSYFSGPPGIMAKIWQWATTVDHKKIGVMYLFAVLSMFFIHPLPHVCNHVSSTAFATAAPTARRCDG